MKLEINIDDNFLIDNMNTRRVSFTKCLDLLKGMSKSLQKEKGFRPPTFVLDNKLVGYDFAKICGVNTPRIYQAGKALKDLIIDEKMVIKPMYENSSKGVYVSYAKDKTIYLNTGEVFANFSDVKSHAQSLINSKYVRFDSWMTEALLGEYTAIARDVKFYCFYGEIGLILETDRNSGIKRCWFDEDLNYVDTGKYNDVLYKASRDRLIELKEIAKKLSLEIPAAFVRIDFMIDKEQIYLGEYTPLPGQYNDFNMKWDAYLGELFINAGIQLAYDIASGKQFEKYKNTPKREKILVDIINSNFSK